MQFEKIYNISEGDTVSYSSSLVKRITQFDRFDYQFQIFNCTQNSTITFKTTKSRSATFYFKEKIS